MKYEPEKSEFPVQCTNCGWSGKLDQTEDQDVLNSDFETSGQHCICPKCGTAVSPAYGDSAQT